MYKIEKYKTGYVIKKKVWYGWRKIKYSDYGAKENKVKIFKTEYKAQWIIDTKLTQ